MMLALAMKRSKTHDNFTRRFVVIAKGQHPASIPNPEVKPFSADGTGLSPVE